jgi:hypothetical protein
VDLAVGCVNRCLILCAQRAGAARWRLRGTGAGTLVPQHGGIAPTLGVYQGHQLREYKADAVLRLHKHLPELAPTRPARSKPHSTSHLGGWRGRW